MSPFWTALELRVMEAVVTTGAIRRANHHQQQTNTQHFTALMDAIPVAQPTVKVLKGKDFSM